MFPYVFRHPTTAEVLARVKMAWMDDETAAEQGSTVHRLLLGHMAGCNAVLRASSVVGVSTDKASIRCMNLQPSVFFTETGMACIAPPQVPLLLGGCRIGQKKQSEISVGLWRILFCAVYTNCVFYGMFFYTTGRCI